MGPKRAGSKGKYFREQGAEDSGHFTKLFHIIVTIFLCLASLGWFPATYFAFPPVVYVVNHLIFWPIYCHWYQINIPLIQAANERNFREQGDCENDLGEHPKLIWGAIIDKKKTGAGRRSLNFEGSGELGTPLAEPLKYSWFSTSLSSLPILLGKIVGLPQISGFFVVIRLPFLKVGQTPQSVGVLGWLEVFPSW